MEECIEKNKEFEPEIRYFNEHYPEIVTNEVEGMFELLTQLKAEGYKLYGLTNWCSKVYLTMAQFPIFKLLDGQIISSEEKVIKPEPEIYQRLFTKFNLKPEECIFTDDRVENIEGGSCLGMDGIVFKDAKQYERELREYLAFHQDTIVTELEQWLLHRSLASNDSLLLREEKLPDDMVRFLHRQSRIWQSHGEMRFYRHR